MPRPALKPALCPRLKGPFSPAGIFRKGKAEKKNPNARGEGRGVPARLGKSRDRAPPGLQFAPAPESCPSPGPDRDSSLPPLPRGPAPEPGVCRPRSLPLATALSCPAPGGETEAQPKTGLGCHCCCVGDLGILWAGGWLSTYPGTYPPLPVPLSSTPHGIRPSGAKPPPAPAGARQGGSQVGGCHPA